MALFAVILVRHAGRIILALHLHRIALAKDLSVVLRAVV